MNMRNSNAADRLAAAIQKTGNPTAIGLDTQTGHLPASFAVESLATSAERCAALLDYNIQMLKVVEGLVPCVKVQVAYYEMLGVQGLSVFARTLQTARAMGFVTIADCKRNDIGATSGAYAAAYLTPKADFEADFITVNGYLGSDGIAPFVDQCKAHGKGLFVLVKTSNPSSGELQDMAMQDGRTLYQSMADRTMAWGEGLMGQSGYSAIGAVVGATYPEQGRELRARMPSTFFLVPGYGAQGATGADLRGCFDAQGGGAVVNASRSLLTAHQKHTGLSWEDALRKEAIAMRDDIAPKG